jgi:dihydroorotase
MANTNPVNDNGSVTEFILKQARAGAVTRVYPIGAVTKGQKGETLAEIGDMREAGAVALSDDGSVIANSDLMRRGLEYAKTFDLAVITHSEDMSLVGEGVMNEGFVSTELGLPASPHEAEEIMIFRDVTLAALTGARLHVAHVTTAGGVAIIREAKRRGVAVTAETCPHYITLTDDAVRTFDTNTKVNPPLRTQDDVDAVIEGLADGTIDAIASDHAPHADDDKEVEFIYAKSGMIGLETLLPLSLAAAGRKLPESDVDAIVVDV